MPNISTEKVCFNIIKAREFDVKVDPVDSDPGSNASDDNMSVILEDFADDATYQELKSFIEALNQDEHAELVALMWVGRGEFEATELDKARSQAMGHSDAHTAEYLLGTPLLSDYLEEALNKFDLSCEEFELGRL